jgi:hypothetical protein
MEGGRTKGLKTAPHFILQLFSTGWQLQYMNDLYAMLEARGVTLTPMVKALVLGGETAMWTEQVNYAIKIKYNKQCNIFPLV